MFPDELKCAEIAPAYKKKNKLHKENHRPISNLTSISKVIEGIMGDQMRSYMSKKLSDYLAAYRKGYSCEQVLMKVIEDWRTALDQNEYVGCILMDLSKAFDSVPHALVISKLKEYGMSINTCEMMKSYLTNRKQRVKLGDVRSEWRVMERGVPQGSVIGPLIFNIFMNDLFYFITVCDLYNYADDNSIAKHDKSLDIVKDSLELASLDAVIWFMQNYMEANADKFQAILMSRNDQQTVVFNVNGTLIQSEKCVKLLGVQIDTKLLFNDHISTICKRAAGQLKAMYRLPKVLSIESKLKMYSAFIMSNFIYCNLVWHACGLIGARNIIGQTNGFKIERIQERCLRYIYEDFNSSFSILLKKANKSSMFLIRIRKLAHYVHKVLQGEVPMFMSNMYNVHRTPYNMRDNFKIDLIDFNTLTYGKRSLKYEGAWLYNNLPCDLKVLDTIQFKAAMNVWEGPQCNCGECILCNAK